MHKIPISSFVICLIISVSFSACRKNRVNKEATIQECNIIKPYRVLVIIGDQWTDPMSYNIDPSRVNEEDFLDVITMLKIWGVPFDILRLDEQRLQINRFLDGEANPNYGCMIWMDDSDKLKGYSANYETLERAVNEYGISMIALTDYIKTDAAATLAGLEFKNVQTVMTGENGEKFEFSGDHFITGEAKGLILPDNDQLASSSIPETNGITINTPGTFEVKEKISMVNCTVNESALVLGKIGQIPQFVVRDIDSDTKVIWIGGGKDWFRIF